jgi:chorismate mutase-like protein
VLRAGTGTGTRTRTRTGRRTGIGVLACAIAVLALPVRAQELPVLRVGTSGDYAPFSKDGVGFDIEVARQLAADLGYRLELVPFRWPELAEAVRSGAFDVAMSGVTWRPDRAVLGTMSRTVARGGPCVLSQGNSPVVAVNRGGVLERWARGRYPEARLRVVERNLELPELLARGEVGAIVTDSFELAHFQQPGARSHCQPPRDRKVYWVSPGAPPELATRLDGWLASHGAELDALGRAWLGGPTALSPRAHLIDLLGRRLELMESVAAYKRTHGLPITDPAREQQVLAQARADAEVRGLAGPAVEALFALQITLAKRVQLRARQTAPLDLQRELRPALDALSAAIVQALIDARVELSALELAELEPLSGSVRPAERRRLWRALQALAPRPAPAAGPVRHKLAPTAPAP